MATTEKPVKITVNIEDKELYRAVRHAAIEKDKTLREIVTEALRDWLDKQEEEGTIPWEQVKAEMREARESGRGG